MRTPRNRRWGREADLVMACVVGTKPRPRRRKAKKYEFEFVYFPKLFNAIASRNFDWATEAPIQDTPVEVELRAILDRLADLNNKENVNDYIFKPTPHAYRTAKHYIEKLYSKKGLILPEPSFVSDGEGGIDIEWNVGDNEVMLSCRAEDDQEDFLYVRKGNVRFTELDLSLLKILEHLKELNNA